MGVGLYSVSCGFGCGCGFGGFTSLIAMVLALRAREALRMGMGGKVFSGSLPSIGTRSPHLSATGRLVIASQSAALCGEMPCRFPGVPCNTFTAHPAAPLGSRAAFRRPVSFAQDLATREGQRPRCPYGGESGSGDAAPPSGLCRKQSNQMKLRAKIPYEMSEASFMREAHRHLPLENQMSHTSHASHPQAESKARSTLQSPLPSHPQVCGGEKCASPLQACVKCILCHFQGGLRVALCRGCVISGDAKLQRNWQSRQCPPGWSGVLSPLHPPWATNATAHRAAFCRLVCPVRRILASASTNKPRKGNKPNETHKNPDQGKAS